MINKRNRSLSYSQYNSPAEIKEIWEIIAALIGVQPVPEALSLISFISAGLKKMYVRESALERQIVCRTFCCGFLSWRERSRSTISRRERRGLRHAGSCHWCAWHRLTSYGLLTTNDIVSANVVKPTSIELMGVDIELNGQVLTLNVGDEARMWCTYQLEACKQQE